MNAIANLPIEMRLVVLFLAGLWLGRYVNRGIYQLAWKPRILGPWSPAPPQAPPRHPGVRALVLGWWLLRRESPWHGTGYWVRPLLIELAVGVGCAALYWGEVERLWLWPAAPGLEMPAAAVLHAQYLAHVMLMSLMLVATFIDFDEQTIPDAITVTGTVAGLLLAVLLPYAALPTLVEPLGQPASVHHMVCTSSSMSSAWRDGLGGPNSWPTVLDQRTGLAVALAAVWASCLAILHKTWTLRRGWVQAVRYLVASVVRHRTWPVPAVLGGLLSLLVLVTWSLGTARWESLCSSMIGLCFAGGLIWSVRIIGGHTLRVEAMGFGDVTLLAMIGAFLGWQASFLVFFLAPFTALLVAATQWLITGERRIAFGPYLCLAAVIVLVAWDPIWTEWASLMFSLPWFIPLVLVGCLAVMGGLLWFWRLVRDAFF